MPDADELEGIFAHELVHLTSRDSLVGTLAYSLARTLVGVLAVLLFPVALLMDGLSKGLRGSGADRQRARRESTSSGGRSDERASHPAGGLLATLYVHAEESDPLIRMLSTHPPVGTGR